MPAAFPARLLRALSALVLVASLPACAPRGGEASAPVAGDFAARLDVELRLLREEVERLAAHIVALHERRDEIVAGGDRTIYAIGRSGVMHKPVNDGRAALWVSARTPHTPEIVDLACFTEPLGDEFRRICREFPAVSQVFYNDRRSLNRIYPWIDTVTQFPPDIVVQDFNFFYLADAGHNPARRGVWVSEPYVDPAGRGWTVSTMAPVYLGEQLEGVPGFDITVETLVERYLRSLNRAVAVVSAQGVIVAATERAVLLLEMPPLKDHKYLETVKLETFKPDEYNLLKSTLRPVRAMAGRLLSEQPGRLAVELQGRPHAAHSARVPELGWTVVEFIPE